MTSCATFGTPAIAGRGGTPRLPGRVESMGNRGALQGPGQHMCPHQGPLRKGDPKKEGKKGRRTEGGRTEGREAGGREERKSCIECLHLHLLLPLPVSLHADPPPPATHPPAWFLLCLPVSAKVAPLPPSLASLMSGFFHQNTIIICHYGFYVSLFVACLHTLECELPEDKDFMLCAFTSLSAWHRADA